MGETEYLTSACAHCANDIEFPAEGVGTIVDCPHCGQQTVLGSTVESPAPTLALMSASELKSAFAGPIIRPKLPFLYRVGIVLASAVMVMLPVAYLGFVAFITYGIYWYAGMAWSLFDGPVVKYDGTNWSILNGPIGGMIILLFKFAIYFGPILGGILSVCLMLKPFFARSLPTVQPLAINPAVEPRVYQFIAHICDMAGAPMPNRIDLVCQPKAAAGFRRGLFRFLGNDFVLVLGLPLIAGLNMRQLTALVAHEFGHFTQGTGMRLGYVIFRVDEWLARIIYQRDAWDVAIADFAATERVWYLWIVAICACFGVWLSRQVLKLLLFFGHAVICFLSRQQEYHADRYATALAGSEGFESMLLRVNEQTILFDIALEGLNDSWRSKRQLADNLPIFLNELESRMPAEFHDQAQNTLLNQKTLVFDTHPTSNQRIQECRRRADPGVFQLEAPASTLFSNFESISKMVTMAHYRDVLRLPFNESMLKPVGAFLKPLNSER